MTEIQEQIISLRKELRQDYENLCKKYYEILIQLDNYFAYLGDSLDKKELKGGQEDV